jgi:peptidoglycan/xylan/chitin deacetylase (PgdA/CDA1 family)
MNPLLARTRTVFVTVLIAWLLIASASGAGNGGSPVVARFAAVGRPLVCGGPYGRDVALTFDDGPGPYSAGVVALLQRARERATFFLVGKEIALRSGVPALERRVAALGDHTWSHPRLTLLGNRAIRGELQRAKLAIERKAHVQVQLFRPPYGAHSRRVDGVARRLGMLEVLWSVDSRDSKRVRWYQIAENVDHSLRPGSIVVMHENHGQTVRALRDRILPYLRVHGLHSVSIPELLRVDPPSQELLAAGLAGCLRVQAGRR